VVRLKADTTALVCGAHLSQARDVPPHFAPSDIHIHDTGMNACSAHLQVGQELKKAAAG